MQRSSLPACQTVKMPLMRIAVILSLLVMLTAFQCHRTCTPENGSYSLQGKWRFTEFYISPGDGSQNWQAPPPGQTYVEFRNDGSFATDFGSWSNYNRYEIKNDSTVLLLAPPSSNQVQMHFTIQGSLLTLRPPCFEGCAYRFGRQ